MLLKLKDKLEICKLHEEGYSISSLSKRFNA